MFKGGSHHRIRGLFEKALGNDRLCSSVLLWRCYIMFEMEIAHDPSAARRAFFRAIHSCPWWELCFKWLNDISLVNWFCHSRGWKQFIYGCDGALISSSNSHKNVPSPIVIISSSSLLILILIPGQKGYGWMVFSSWTLSLLQKSYLIYRKSCVIRNWIWELTYMRSFCKSHDIRSPTAARIRLCKIGPWCKIHSIGLVCKIGTWCILCFHIAYVRKKILI